MAMIGKSRVDKKMMALYDLLSQDEDITLEGVDRNRVKVSMGDRSCYLPTHYIGNSMDSEIRRKLNGIGVQLTTEGLPNPGDAAVSVDMTTLPPAGTPASEVFGFHMSETTETTLMALMAAINKDIVIHTKKAVEAATEDAINTLSDSANAEDIARLERELERARGERETAVADLVRQRDEARSRVKVLEQEIGDLRHGLELIGIKLPVKSDA